MIKEIKIDSEATGDVRDTRNANGKTGTKGKGNDSASCGSSCAHNCWKNQHPHLT